DLDFLLVLVRGLIHDVVVLRLAEEVADLAAGHRHEPADQGRHRWIPEHHRVGSQKAFGAHQMQRLVYPTVMVLALIVPTLPSQGLEKALNNCSPSATCVSTLWVFDESGGRGAWIGGRRPCIRRTGSDQTAARADGLAARAALVPPALEKRMSEKCPNGGIARRSTRRMPRQRLAQSA